ncbi:MAG: 16S rRNA (uracil(1498)-N(3))-methyltransferase [Akkermansiaceae bacterium]|jgi:16S rRNA (uracil1498-N3)-methyltransferase|nr:16S rRNA (uracil(1498)-N(3))-methyltransferase [Akkermansiaceae bacterium]
MARFHLPASEWQSASLTGDEARHLSQVLRIKPGETITVFDGMGQRAKAEVLTVSRDLVSLKLAAPESPPIPLPEITLAQAIPKGKNMDLIVQKAVELGIARIQPLVTKNTIVQPGEGKSDKWRRNALEACKQCGQDTLPQIADPLPFDRWIASLTESIDLKIIASLAPGALPLRETLQRHPGTTAATLLVGPEGDFTGQEVDAAITSGFHPVSLGSIILRVETATLYCLSALRYEFSESQS